MLINIAAMNLDTAEIEQWLERKQIGNNSIRWSLALEEGISAANLIALYLREHTTEGKDK